MTDKPTVHEAILTVMETVGAVGKDSRNAQRGFNFRGIDATVNALAPAMRAAGLTVRPVLVSLSRGHATTSKGTTMNVIDVIVDYTFTGPAGDEVTSRVPGESFDSGDKATAKAMSVAFRTALLQTFTLPTQDPDPDLDTYERGQPAAQPVAQQPPWTVAQAQSAVMECGGDKARLSAAWKFAHSLGTTEEVLAVITEAANAIPQGQ